MPCAEVGAAVRTLVCGASRVTQLPSVCLRASVCLSRRQATSVCPAGIRDPNHHSKLIPVNWVKWCEYLYLLVQVRTCVRDSTWVGLDGWAHGCGTRRQKSQRDNHARGGGRHLGSCADSSPSWSACPAPPRPASARRLHTARRSLPLAFSSPRFVPPAPCPKPTIIAALQEPRNQVMRLQAADYPRATTKADASAKARKDIIGRALVKLSTVTKAAEEADPALAEEEAEIPIKVNLGMNDWGYPGGPVGGS